MGVNDTEEMLHSQQMNIQD